MSNIGKLQIRNDRITISLGIGPLIPASPTTAVDRRVRLPCQEGERHLAIYRPRAS